MAYLPKSVVEKNIRTRVRKGRGGKEHVDYEAYIGVDPFDHHVVRYTRTDKNELMDMIDDFYMRHRFGGDAAVRITAMQAIDAKNAYDALASAGLKVSLLDVVTKYIDGTLDKKSDLPEKDVLEAFNEFYGTKKDGADKSKTFATSGKWARALAGRILSSITAKEIAAYLVKNYDAKKPKTYNSHLLYIKTFLNWCCKEAQGYLDKSPARSLEFKPEPWEEPEYMKPDEVEKLFRLLESHKADRPELLAYAIVNFFCGCRAVEIRRMAKDPAAAKIDLESATIRIAKAKGFQQGKRPRSFNIHPTALAWMNSFNFSSALNNVSETDIGVSGTRKDIYDLARENGIQVFQNCGRHTFITYHVAAYGDPAKTTAMVGTSDKMRADNYCGLASKADGEAYFAIMPSTTTDNPQTCTTSESTPCCTDEQDCEDRLTA